MSFFTRYVLLVLISVSDVVERTFHSPSRNRWVAAQHDFHQSRLLSRAGC